MPMYQKKEKTEENKSHTNHLPSPRRKRRPVGKEAGRRWPSRSRKKRDIVAVFQPQDTHIFAAFLEKQKKPDYNKRKWQGACLDTGAQRTVIGLPQARAYCRYMGCRLTLAKSRTVFRFGVGVSKSRGILHMRIPTPNESFMLLAVDVVDADIPFLVGLDILDLFQLNVDTVQNQLRAPKAGWSIPLVRKNGHIYLEWKPEDRILFTKAELTRLHRGFFHPPNSRLIKLIQRAKRDDLNAEARKILDDIAKSCETCQRLGPKPLRFRASIPEDIDKSIFSDDLSIDLFWIRGAAILQVVDVATRFTAATYLDKYGASYGQSVDGIWAAFLDCWVTMYTGYPNQLRTDAGSIFVSPRWKQLADAAGIQLQISGVESHNSIGVGETLHAPLRRIYNKVAFDFPNAPPQLILKCAVKAMNDTIGENGLVPSLLVFGMIPRFPILTSEIPHQQERMRILQVAQAEMNSIVAERRIVQALKSAVPAAADRVYQVGEEVLVYREKERTWAGPYTVKHIDEKIVLVYDPGSNYVQRFNVAQIKPYFRDLPDTDPEDQAEILHSMLSKFISDEGANMSPAYNIHLTEVLCPGDPRAELFGPAKEKEIAGLIERGTWKVVLRSELPENANIMNGRFVLSIKNAGTEEEVFKARYVIQGYRDKMKTSLVHNSPTSRKASTKLLVGLAAVFGFRLFSTDVTQAFLQSAEDLMRDVYLDPKGEFELSSDQVLKILKPLYGLADSGDYWAATFSNHLTQDLGMQQTVGDPAFFYKHIKGKLAGLCCSYVDDCLQAGDTEFETLADKTTKRFDCRAREYDHTTYVGMEVEACNDGNGFQLHQRKYISRLQPLPEGSTYKSLMSLRQKLLWVNSSRPDIAFSAAQASQITEEMFEEDRVANLKVVNDIVTYLKKVPDLPLRYPRLDKKSIQIKAYADASFAGNRDGTSQLGYIVFLSDKHGTCQPILWSSHKSKRVTRSVVGAETMALADVFDAAYTMKHDLQAILKQKVPLTLHTDSLSLFDVLTKATLPTEKRLAIDVLAIKDAYKNRELDTIAFIRTHDNPADVLTKKMSAEVLAKILRSAKLEHDVQQWVERPN